MREEQRRGLEVVGATANPSPEELPHFLDPICVDGRDPDSYFIAHVSPWDKSAPQLYPITRERLEEESEAGFWWLFDDRFPFLWEFRLVALEQSKLPAYLPAEEAYRRVHELGVKALERANQELNEKLHTEETKTLLWYAARAIRDDPFPLLAAIAFDRTSMPEEMITDLLRELPPPSSHDSELTVHARQENWFALLKLVESDPLGAQYALASSASLSPTRHSPFLVGMPDVADFLRQFQRSFGLVGSKIVA